MPRWVGHLGLMAAAFALLLMPRDHLLPKVAAVLLVIPLAITGVKRTDTFRWWAIYVIAFFGFAYVRDLGDQFLPVLVHYPIVADRAIGLGAQPVNALQSFYSPGWPRWWDHVAIAVHISYFPVVPITGLFLWRSARLRPLLMGCVGVYVVSVLICLLLPTAPPWMAGQMGAMPTVYKIIRDVLGGVTPGFYEYGLRVAGSNPVAAMPSVHAAIAAIIGLVGLGTRWAVPGIGYTVLMGMSLVYLGEHYVVDVLAGWLVAFSCWRWASAPAGTTPPPR